VLFQPFFKDDDPLMPCVFPHRIKDSAQGGVSVREGAIAFTRMRGANSAANGRVSPSAGASALAAESVKGHTGFNRHRAE